MSHTSVAKPAYQAYVDRIGSYAATSTPAYSLASLFALCAPFSFPGGRDRQRIQSAASPTSPLGKAVGSNLKSAVPKGVAGAAAARGVLPPFWQLAGFAAFFGAGGYMIDQGDSLNGSGTITGESDRPRWSSGSYCVVEAHFRSPYPAWSLIYLFFHGANTIRRPSLPTLTLTLSTAAVGASIHGAHYFSQENWKNPKEGSKTVEIPSLASVMCITALPSAAFLSRRRPDNRQIAIFKRLFTSSRSLKSPPSSTSSSSSSSSSSSAMPSKMARFSTPIDVACLPVGFKVAATYAGIKAAISPVGTPPSFASSKAKPKPDLALITTNEPVAAAGTFTRNVFKAAPVVLSSDLLLQGSKTKRGSRVKSVLVNSGCANAVTGQGGYDDAKKCAEWISKLRPSKVEEDNKTLLLSTGVIGVPLPMSAIEKALPNIANEEILGNEEEKWWEVARAFMTTDTFPKLKAKQFTLGGRRCGIVGIDKGAGMIHPSMAGPSSSASGSSSSGASQLHATLLGLVCTDAPIAPAALQEALEEAMSRSFNCISVDGDMSTNDTIIALASGLAPEIDSDTSGSSSSTTIKPDTEIDKASHPKEYAIFVKELTQFCTEMAHLIVRDGEGAEKFVEIQVKGAPTYSDAHAIASSISTSALVKCALHGSDANWGRILCAAGYTNLRSSSSSFQTQDWAIDPATISVRFLKPSTSTSPEAGHDDPDDVVVKELIVLQNGTPVKVDEAKAAALLGLEDIIIEIDLKGGTWGQRGDKEMCKYWTCDFSKEYIAINGDYRS